VNDARDLGSLNQVRGHLQLIAAEFAEGNFEKPFATHGEMPPGVETMRRRRSTISYSFERTDGGGRVRISTGDDEARAAIYEFLRYQIREHKTGDSLSIPRQRPPSR
jgi:hypothetical protein